MLGRTALTAQILCLISLDPISLDPIALFVHLSDACNDRKLGSTQTIHSVGLNPKHFCLVYLKRSWQRGSATLIKRHHNR
ncbi:hypothetical protein PHSY_001557 [Pseudozyma hubeiensis SY62]|uniref:Uncharacterized protein n=1 Tax=Pseudozyma hubeiensis (strain SY62) TaxID=1305764 RepID=R9NYT3_PSEHS|nr:hypothetical protein PHSY_001557 [Pseudozyma hubeiensis SY62]GAC93988.1 hypothetical protein PHSY_001557 [Pseudozyma hubeiensis SY62]